MKHRKGIDLIQDGDTGYTVGEGSLRTSPSTETGYRVEVWSAEPEAGGEVVETISYATDFSVSCARCKHKGLFDRWEQARLRGKGVYLSTLETKLRCTGCQNRTGNRLTIARLRR